MTSIIKVDTIQKQDGSAFPLGNLLQVQKASLGTTTSGITGSTWVTSGLSLNFTPQFSTSKIYVSHTAGGITQGSLYTGIKIVRNSTDVVINWGYHDHSNWNLHNFSLVGIDEPNTTSQVTYTVQLYANTGTNFYWNYNTGSTQLVAMEIAQ